MDLAVIRQQILSSNTSTRKKAEALLSKKEVYDLSTNEWRELIVAVPADVEREIGMLKAAGTHDHWFCVSPIIKAWFRKVLARHCQPGLEGLL